MRSNTRYRYGSTFRSAFPPAVKWLLIANFAVWLLNYIADRTGLGGFFDPLKLVPAAVVHGEIWQVFTFLFLHSTSNPLHILFNMLALWMFGCELERTWGTRRFLKYYVICGIGSGITVVLVGIVFGYMNMVTYGASGAIYGLLLAFGLLFPDMIIYLIIFPIKAKYFVMIAGGLALFFSISGGNSGVSNVAHLGGLAVGFAYLRFPLIRADGATLQRQYQRWKLERAKRKFEVYMRKQGSKKEPWVH